MTPAEFSASDLASLAVKRLTKQINAAAGQHKRAIARDFAELRLQLQALPPPLPAPFQRQRLSAPCIARH